jgi:hypothetical protein
VKAVSFATHEQRRVRRVYEEGVDAFVAGTMLDQNPYRRWRQASITPKPGRTSWHETYVRAWEQGWQAAEGDTAKP